MTNDEKNCEKVDMLIRLQQSEASLSVGRNNYFIVMTSLLILALSQFKIPSLQLIISGAGVLIAITWLLTHDRSSRYTKYWKRKASDLSKELNCPLVYPEEIGGFEMRSVLYILPITFLAFWIIIFVCALNFPTIINPPTDLEQCLKIACCQK